MKINPTEAKAASEIFAAPIAASNGFQTEESLDINVDPSPPTQAEQTANTIAVKTAAETFGIPTAISRKRKASEEEDEETASSKRFKEDEVDLDEKAIPTDTTGMLDKLGLLEARGGRACKYEQLPPEPEGTISLFFKSDFRDHLCRCSDCFPRMAKHPQLLEEEETYEPPVSEGDDGEGSTVGSGSLLDRGERALTNVDRVRAIEGVMAYNHLKEKLKPFFQEFAESGKAISAEDIKAHFAKIRGDEEAIKQAGEAAANSGDNRREQSGY